MVYRSTLNVHPGLVTVVAHEIRETGGMERAQARIVIRLLEAGWQVDVLARVCELSPHPRLRWTRIPTPRSPFIVAFPLFAIWASAVLARRTVGVTTALGAIIFSRTDVCTVQFCHHGFEVSSPATRCRARGVSNRVNQWLAARMARWMERWCYRPGGVRRLIAVSNTIAEEIRTTFPSHKDAVSIVPNGVDVRRFRPSGSARKRIRCTLGLPTAAKVAVFVGGDWERKGLAVAIEAIGLRADWWLLVVGPGDPSAYVKIARMSGAEERVRFAGPQSETAPYFGAGDAFVLPTLYEGFALVTLEAAATGLPLLVTEAAGAAGLALDGVTGWVLERDAGAFANALGRLEEPAAARMGAAARKQAAGFSWEDIGDAHAEIYARLRDDATA